MSSPESIKNKNVHDFKTCRKTGLKESRSRKLGLCHCLHLLFIAGIQMDADSNHGCHERIMLLCVYEHTVQSVIIEDPVGGVIVHCRIQAHIRGGNSRHMFFQFMESDKEIDRIMTLCAGKTQNRCWTSAPRYLWRIC